MTALTLAATLLVPLLSLNTANPVQAVMDHYQGIAAYQVTLTSVSGDKTEIIRYSYKKPGHVRMEFVTPFKGAVLIYDPGTRRAKLWPFGYGRFPGLGLSPDNSLIQSATGQRVDRSDVGALYRNVKTLQDQGRLEVMGLENIGGQEVLRLMVSGDNGVDVGNVARYQLWLERSHGFPLKVVSYDKNGRVIETVEMNQLRVDPEFPGDFFSQ